MFFKNPFEYFLKEPVEKTTGLEDFEDEKKLIEILRENCEEPITGAKNLPVFSFKELMKKFKTTDLVAVTETKQYQEMIKRGFILRSGEERIYYGQKPGQPSEDKQTNIHLGVDYVMESGSNVFAINDGKIIEMEVINKNKQELFQKSNQEIYHGEGGYGNMLLLEHQLNGRIFYSLYGHLAASKKPFKIGDFIKGGQIIGIIGKSFSLENGGWPAHLHFNILKERSAVAGYGTKEDLKKIIDPLKIFK